MSAFCTKKHPILISGWCLWFSFQAGDQRWLRTISSALHLLHSLYGPFSKVYGIGHTSKVRPLHMHYCRTNIDQNQYTLLVSLCRGWFSVLDFLHVLSSDDLWPVEGPGWRCRHPLGWLWGWKCLSHWQRWSLFCLLHLLLWFFMSWLKLFSSDVDYVTPLCSQVVYEGLVDDIFRIKCGGFCGPSCPAEVPECLSEGRCPRSTWTFTCPYLSNILSHISQTCHLSFVWLEVNNNFITLPGLVYLWLPGFVCLWLLALVYVDHICLLLRLCGVWTWRHFFWSWCEGDAELSGQGELWSDPGDLRQPPPPLLMTTKI